MGRISTPAKLELGQNLLHHSIKLLHRWPTVRQWQTSFLRSQLSKKRRKEPMKSASH